MSGLVTGIAAAVGMVVLILDCQTAAAGAREGITLCLQTVIPSLFPFFLLSDLLTGSLQGRRLRLLRPICKLWGMPEGSQPLLLTGLLGGYPVGARCVSQACESGTISKADARKMIVSCNACGPAFLFGIGSGILGGVGYCLLAWLIVVISAWICTWILPGRPEAAHFRPIKRRISVLSSLNKALKSMASVCAWVVLFRVGLSFLERWVLGPLPQTLRIGILGFLELTNGCVGLNIISGIGLRFILFVGMITFGGLCVSMQTLSSIAPGIPTDLYFPGKLLQGCISVLLAWLVQLAFPNALHSLTIPSVAVLIGGIIAIFLRKAGKNSSISVPVGV